MRYIRQGLGLTALVSMMTLSSLTWAAPKETPPEFVKRVADELISQLAQNRDQLDDSVVTSKIVIHSIDPHIDAQGFTRLVMGEYYSDAYSTQEQRLRFSVNFRNSVIRRYGSSLSQYSNEGYTLKPYQQVGDNKYPVVSIEFKARSGGKIPVSFQLIDKNDEWKIRNMNVNGIDLALTFRDQFKSTVQQNSGNLDKAIASFKPHAEAAANKK